MDNAKIALMKERIKEQIDKINNKDFTLYFYVIDTKVNPSGSLSYIYDIALGLNDMGYKVCMMHSEEDFVGVEEWLGKDYANLPHINVENKTVDITPSDFLFIPEIYSNVMTATRKLPCQRIAILQSFDKLTEFIPFGAGWGDLGIFKAITTTEKNAKQLNNYFPYVKTDVITPQLSKVFTKPTEIKKLMVNIVTRNQSDTNKIVKPFFWQYPMYKWVAFRELRGLSRIEFAEALKEAAITVWVDDVTDFGYTPLEAMKCNSLVVGVTPDNMPEWMMDKDDLSNAGIWVENITSLPQILASVIRTWTIDGIPVNIQQDADKLTEKYSQSQQLKDIKRVIVDGIIENRKKEYETTFNSLNNTDKKEEN